MSHYAPKMLSLYLSSSSHYLSMGATHRAGHIVTFHEVFKTGRYATE
ncbi:MAG: hypothetical protein HQK72_08520 [Desulfamplus sp.]|nr:hypothetical protein [Desulfamplus sp.]